MSLPIDRSFVAMVPLGGRHVNHLWKLLAGLDIPYATLLDLDYGREGGAWIRIKSIVEQLLRVHPGSTGIAPHCPSASRLLWRSPTSQTLSIT